MRPEEKIMCIFNNSEETKEINVPVAQESQIKKWDTLVDLISGNKIKAGERNITITLPAKGYAYYQWENNNCMY
jgi:hypothetical protein